MSLFNNEEKNTEPEVDTTFMPLAARMRPVTIDEVVGQRPGEPEQHQLAQRGADAGGERVPALRPGGEGAQPPDHRQRTDREHHAGRAMGDRGHHLHLTLVDLQVR